ncbi:MAG TPA: TonB family protein [Candidatus Acidoferrales bacterium]|nr:TonB family protein [Candidatus Acidoferrales bacterium]
MATQTTDLPLSSATTKTRTGSDNLEAEAIGLEVPVRIHGSQVTAVVMETTEHAEPFEEDTSTMIVFPRGAVVKLLARVRTGHTVVLTHLRSHQNVTCKVIQVNSANNVVHYVKLEFVQESQGFWGVHFPSEPLPVAQKKESAPAPRPMQSKPVVAPAAPVEPPATPAPPDPASTRDIFSHASVPPRPTAPLVNDTPPPLSPSAYAPPSAPPVAPSAGSRVAEMKFPSTVAPTTPPREIPKPVAPKESPAASKPSGYGMARNWQKEQIEPLGGSPATHPEESVITSLADVAAPAVEKIPVPGRRPQPAPPAPPKTKKARGKPTRPVFGELHTFGSAATSDAPLNLSSVTQTESEPLLHGPKLLPALAALCIITVIAAGVMFVVRHPSLLFGSSAAVASNSSAQNAPLNQPQAANPPQASTSQPLATSTSSAPPSLPEAATITRPPVENSSAAEKNSSATTAAPISEKPAKGVIETRHAAAAYSPSSGSAAPKSIANLYAGDLNARPKVKPHTAKHLDAQLPDITASAPAGISDSPDSVSLGSIVPGASASGLAVPAAPANPEPEVRQGGDVQPPKLISSVPPVYPALAKQNNVEGDVKIQAEIGISGNVTSMKVLTGPVLLRSAAMDALRHWRYAPAKLDGKPISTEYVVIIRFRLGN